MTQVWRLLSRRVFHTLLGIPILLDLVDPTSRSEADLRELLDLLPYLAPACPVSLGVNLNEANILARLLGLTVSDDSPERLRGLSAALTDAIGIHEVVIHALHHAATPTAVAAGPYCTAPVKLTGAGDRFNAGYALGLMLGLPDGERLALGCAASGWFVRYGHSATIPDLVACGCQPS
jgi:sugar/nucleoside kinase (ribokinase family)